MRRDGFTLLEVLVAFVIAALALAALYNGGIGGLRAAVVSGRYLEAVSRAQSHLDTATVGDSLTPSDRQGDEADGFHWRVRVTQAAVAATDPAAPQTRAALALYSVSAAVSWTENGRSRAVQLDTQRAAAAPLPPPP